MRTTAEQIRGDSQEMVRGFINRNPSDKKYWFLLAQSAVVALQEIAAQLAEANERGDGAKHVPADEVKRSRWEGL